MKTYSEFDLQEIWTEAFIDDFSAAKGREPSDDEIVSAFNRTNFNEWISEWLADNPASE